MEPEDDVTEGLGVSVGSRHDGDDPASSPGVLSVAFPRTEGGAIINEDFVTTPDAGVFPSRSTTVSRMTRRFFPPRTSGRVSTEASRSKGKGLA
jgi:hypothetical protein